MILIIILLSNFVIENGKINDTYGRREEFSIYSYRDNAKIIMHENYSIKK